MDKKDEVWGPLLGLLSVGTVLVAGIVLGWFAGTWLDRRFGTEPWCMVTGVVLGSVGGFVELFRIVKKTTS